MTIPAATPPMAEQVDAIYTGIKNAVHEAYAGARGPGLYATATAAEEFVTIVGAYLDTLPVAALAPAERVEAVPDARGLLHEAWSVLLTYSRAPVWNEERQKTAEKIRLALGVDAHGVMQPAPTRAGALDAAGVIEKTRDRLVEAVEAWGDGRDAGRVYNVRQTAVMKALNAYLDAKAALAAADVNK